MSDIKVVEITAKSGSQLGPVRGSTIPAKPESQPGDRWIRTKYCWCPDHVDTDCRFHSRKEKGWETCPWEFKAGRAPGRWLWVSLGVPLSDEDLSVGADIPELTKAQQQAGDRFLK